MAKTTRLRDLKTDLGARIARAEAEESRLVRKVDTLREAEEALRVCRGELGMLRDMLATAEKNQPRLETEKELPPAA